MPGTKVGSLDIQFNKDWDANKGNQLVQSLQQVIAAVNLLANQTASPPSPGVAKHVLATQSGLGVDHTVAGLEQNQVLIAQGDTTAHFDFLHFGEIYGTDSGTFSAPADGDVIAFVSGYWSAVPLAGALGLADPGTDAVIMWDTTADADAGGLAWALPGLGITMSSGAIAVNDHVLNHSHLENLLADDHPQYALVGTVPELDAANTFTAPQTFADGLVSGSDITLAGDLEQSGEEPEQRVTNTDDSAEEGTWRLHVEPGQEMWAAVNDDGSDAENWMVVQRIDDVVDTINFSANSLTFNGADVLCGQVMDAPGLMSPTVAGYLTVIVAGRTITVPYVS